VIDGLQKCLPQYDISLPHENYFVFDESKRESEGNLQQLV